MEEDGGNMFDWFVFNCWKTLKTCKNVLVVTMVSIDQQSFVNIVTFCVPRLMVELLVPFVHCTGAGCRLGQIYGAFQVSSGHRLRSTWSRIWLLSAGAVKVALLPPLQDLSESKLLLRSHTLSEFHKFLLRRRGYSRLLHGALLGIQSVLLQQYSSYHPL